MKNKNIIIGIVVVALFFVVSQQGTFLGGVHFDSGLSGCLEERQEDLDDGDWVTPCYEINDNSIECCEDNSNCDDWLEDSDEGDYFYVNEASSRNSMKNSEEIALSCLETHSTPNPSGSSCDASDISLWYCSGDNLLDDCDDLITNCAPENVCSDNYPGHADCVQCESNTDCSGSDTCVNWFCESPSDSCSDTDSGQDFDTKGTVSGVQSGGAFYDTDFCTNDGSTYSLQGNNLREFYCSGTQKLSTTRSCNCYNGACVLDTCATTQCYNGDVWCFDGNGQRDHLDQTCLSSETCSQGSCNPIADTCTETDSGYDLTTKGTMTLNNNPYTDFCYSSSQLKEYACDLPGEGVPGSSTATCPSGVCDNGACVEGQVYCLNVLGTSCITSCAGKTTYPTLAECEQQTVGCSNDDQCLMDELCHPGTNECTKLNCDICETIQQHACVSTSTTDGDVCDINKICDDGYCTYDTCSNISGDYCTSSEYCDGSFSRSLEGLRCCSGTCVIGDQPPVDDTEDDCFPSFQSWDEEEQTCDTETGLILLLVAGVIGLVFLKKSK